MNNRKVFTKNDLETIKNNYLSKKAHFQFVIQMCFGASCISSDSESLYTHLVAELKKENLLSRCIINQTGCMGMCDIGPMMVINPGHILYCKLTKEKIETIVKKHLKANEILTSYCYYDKESGKYIPHMKDIPFYQKQQKIVLKNCGKIDFNSIDEYIATGGYFALEKTLSKSSRDDVISTIIHSGLRGRGGGGFPTGLKWKFAKRAKSETKYIVCNADEGDPGAFMDRSLLEGDPHRIIEGMLIAGYATLAKKGYVYVRAEYPLAIKRLEEAINKARDYGILGENIFNSSFDFDIEIRIGAGAFVCGEETALLASVEGKRGEPSQKPPFPSDEGLFRKPTVINNVETFANVPEIISNGANWFLDYGISGNHGTKIFALAGDIKNTGIIEVPMGMTLGEIIFDIGRGVIDDRPFKAAQTGGPSGGCLTKEHLNAKMDYDSLKELGAIMGSGGLICMDDNTCMVDVARYFMEFVQEESCGKCVACRLGTKRMLEILERITKGKGLEEDIDKLIELGEVIKDTALCGLGQTAPNPILSTIKHFRHEYEAHIKDHYCEAGVCQDLFISPCSNACPANVNIPGYLALVANGKIHEAFELIRQENPFPSVCGSVCTHPCESKCRRAQLDEALAIKDIKKYVADTIYSSDQPFTQEIFKKNGKSVAIIGAGPSGLTCGYYLSKLGYDIDVFEKTDIAGGVLAFGIPQYRLPKEKLKKEIDSIRAVGVNINLNKDVSSEDDFNSLREKYDAVYIATGTQLSKEIGVTGEDLKNVYHGLDFLKDVHFGKDINIKDHVVVVGGGNTAIDASRVALRMGAKKVDLLYRRTKNEMPAETREIEDALEEGVNLIELASPLSFIGDENGVKEIKCQAMKISGFDNKGRRKPTPIEGNIFSLPTDMVILAVSQHSDLPFVKEDEVIVSKYGQFIIDKETHMTKLDGVFAGGDVVRGSDVVITAIADGKETAKSIDKYLGGDGVLNKGKEISIPMELDEDEIKEHLRFPIDTLDPSNRITNFEEVNQGYHKINAIAEAMRCLRCDIKG